MSEKTKGPARIPKSLHPSKTAVPLSVLAMYMQLGQLGTGDCLSTDTLTFPGQWHVSMKISEAQGLKAHQCSSLKPHCCELLSHPRKVLTALPKRWLSPSYNLCCHPLEFSSGCACPYLYDQTSLCYFFCRNAFLDTTGAGQIQSQPSFSILHPHVVNVFTCVIPLTIYIGCSAS